MKRLLLCTLLLSAEGRLAADSTVPDPPLPAADWPQQCAARMQKALDDLIAEDPAFQSGKITVAKGVRFEALVPDREHGRFFSGAPARYFARVIAKRSTSPGALGGNVGRPDDGQASFGLSTWTKRRFAGLDVQIAEGRRVFRFAHHFKPAIADCLR